MKLYDRIFKPRELTLSDGTVVREKRSRTPFILLVIALAIGVSAHITGFSLTTMISRMRYFFVILASMFPPAWSYLRHIWTPLFDTIKMSLLGSAVGALLCIPFAVLSSNNLIHQRAVTSFFKLLFSVVRTLPTLVVALIATYIFGLGTLAGTVAITVFTFAYCGKILYESLETCSMGAYEALEALGCRRMSAIRWGITAQVAPSYLSTVLFCFEGNVRYAAILGYVGAGGLGLILNEKIGWREYHKVGMILIALFVTVAIIEALSQYLRKKIM